MHTGWHTYEKVQKILVEQTNDLNKFDRANGSFNKHIALVRFLNAELRAWGDRGCVAHPWSAVHDDDGQGVVHDAGIGDPHPVASDVEQDGCFQVRRAAKQGATQVRDAAGGRDEFYNHELLAKLACIDVSQHYEMTKPPPEAGRESPYSAASVHDSGVGDGEPPLAEFGAIVRNKANMIRRPSARATAAESRQGCARTSAASACVRGVESAGGRKGKKPGASDDNNNGHAEHNEAATPSSSSDTDSAVSTSSSSEISDRGRHIATAAGTSQRTRTRGVFPDEDDHVADRGHGALHRRRRRRRKKYRTGARGDKEQRGANGDDVIEHPVEVYLRAFIQGAKPSKKAMYRLVNHVNAEGHSCLWQCGYSCAADDDAVGWGTGDEDEDAQETAHHGSWPPPDSPLPPGAGSTTTEHGGYPPCTTPESCAHVHHANNGITLAESSTLESMCGTGDRPPNHSACPPHAAGRYVATVGPRAHTQSHSGHAASGIISALHPSASGPGASTSAMLSEHVEQQQQHHHDDGCPSNSCTGNYDDLSHMMRDESGYGAWKAHDEIRGEAECDGSHGISGQCRRDSVCLTETIRFLLPFGLACCDFPTLRFSSTWLALTDAELQAILLKNRLSASEDIQKTVCFENRGRTLLHDMLNERLTCETVTVDTLRLLCEHPKFKKQNSLARGCAGISALVFNRISAYGHAQSHISWHTAS